MNGSARKLALLLGTLLILRAPRLFAQASPAAIAAFNTYAATVESRLAQQHRSAANFLILPVDPAARTRLRSGELLIEKITTPSAPDALLHHWRATAFIPRATTADFEHLLQNFSAYPHNFAPQIVSSTVLSHTGVPGERSVFAGVTTPDGTLLRLRTRQHHVITVVLDTTCDVTFAWLDTAHGYSISRSTRIDEITPAGDNGFLYRLNTYWSYEQRDGGLYLQIESLSLTRSIPHGLAWAVRPYLESIPRESLVFTLTSARNALRTNH
jgi:hypothetical protein